MRVEIYPYRTGSGCGNPLVFEWSSNTRMSNDILKYITRKMRFLQRFGEDIDRVVALVYSGVINTVTLTLDPDGTMHMISYHPGQMDAVMSICTVKRGGVHNA